LDAVTSRRNSRLCQMRLWLLPWRVSQGLKGVKTYHRRQRAAPQRTLPLALLPASFRQLRGDAPLHMLLQCFSTCFCSVRRAPMGRQRAPSAFGSKSCTKILAKERSLNCEADMAALPQISGMTPPASSPALMRRAAERGLVMVSGGRDSPGACDIWMPGTPAFAGAGKPRHDNGVRLV